MKKILFALLLVSGIAQGQGDRMRPIYKLTGFDVQFFVPGYTNISARYKWIATAVDSGLHIPQYNGVPTGTRTGVWSADGAIAADTANGYLYLYSGGGWIKFAKFSDIAAGAINIYNTSSSLTAARVVEQAGFQFMIQNSSTGMYWRLQPSQGRMEYWAESGAGATFRSVAFDATPDDVFMQAQDTVGNVYLVGAGVGGVFHSVGTGVLLQVSNAAARSLINIKADSIAVEPFQGVINIDTLRTWAATTVTDTAFKKVVTWDIRNGRLEYGNWHGGSGGATPTLQQVLDAGSTLTSSENIATGANTLTISTGTTLVVPLNVTSTDVPSAVFLNNSITQAGLRISKQTSATTQKAVGLNILHTTSGTPDVGFGSSIEFESETVSGQNVQGYFNFNWADPITASRTSHADILGIDNAVTETFMNIQPSLIRFNNNLDTVASRAYARSVGGGGGGWGTTGTVATLTGDATLVQDGNDFVFSGGPVIINETGGDFVFRVEGDGEPNLISTYPAFDRVGIGIASTSIAYKFQVKQSTDKNIGVGSQGSEISLEAVNDAVNAAIPLGIYGSTVSVSGGGVQAILASSTNLVINEAGADLDFRVEGDTDPNLIVANAGLDKVGIKTASPHSSLHVNGSFAKYYLATESGITLDASHSIVEVTATGQTITLPTAVGIEGRIYTIILSASGSATVATTSSQNINGATTYSLASQYKYVTVVSNGTQWYVIANN